MIQAGGSIAARLGRLPILPVHREETNGRSLEAITADAKAILSAP